MKEIFDIAGREILVTGASSGIGREISITLASRGAKITLVGRNNAALEETLRQMEGEDHKIIQSDLSQHDSIKGIGDSQYYGVVFNAGIIEYLPVKFISPEKIRKIFEVNFDGTVLLCQHLLKNRMISKGGSLVFISSVSSGLGVGGTSLYASSKAAINAFSKVVATEVAPQKIRSNTICPGIIVTSMTEQAKVVASSESMERNLVGYPLGFGSPADVSGIVAFLLSDASRWLTGTHLVLDGGLTLQ